MQGRVPDSTDVVVIGAGPAGSAAAALLRRAGHAVCVLERARFPRFVIGESLLPRCMDLLDEAGLLERVMKQGYLEKRGAVFLRGEDRCAFDFSEQFTPGWSYTYQVPRDHFDTVLAEGAQAQGVPIFFEHTVTDVRVGGDPRVTVSDRAGKTSVIACKFVIDASGYGRVLPNLLGLNEPSDLPPRRSLFTHVSGDRRNESGGQITIVVHEGGAWTWIIPFAGDRCSVGTIGDAEFFAQHPADGDAALRAIIDSDPNTKRRLGEASFLFPTTSVNGYSVGIKQLWGEGYCLVGNATEFLDPVFSSGVTLALESSSRAVKVLDRQLRGQAVDWEVEYAAPLARGIDVFRHYVNWWYDGTLAKVFFSPDPEPHFKRMVCSVLAGYAWDESNPFVAEYRRKIPQLARLLA